MDGTGTDKLRFSYSGGIADQGQLNFYELGRAYYASARLVYTVARFCETGKVLSKISERIDTHIVAETPQRGSFTYDAIAFLLPTIAQAVVSAPISVIFAWMWDRILPTNKLEEAVENEAKLELAKLDTRGAVRLSQEETERLRVVRDILASKDRTITELIEVQKSIISQLSEQPDLQREAIAKARLAALENANSRNRLIDPHREELNKISESVQKQLETRIRSTTPEIALPLRSSAEQLSMGTPTNSAVFARLGSKDVAEINAEKEDPRLYNLTCRIIRYDRNGRYGKLRTNEPDSEFGYQEFFFRMASDISNRVHSDVIDAMHLGDVVGSFTVYRGRTNKIERLVLHDIDISTE